jgi:hypothetical protein
VGVVGRPEEHHLHAGLGQGEGVRRRIFHHEVDRFGQGGADFAGAFQEVNPVDGHAVELQPGVGQLGHQGRAVGDDHPLMSVPGQLRQRIGGACHGLGRNQQLDEVVVAEGGRFGRTVRIGQFAGGVLGAELGVHHVNPLGDRVGDHAVHVKTDAQ